MILTDQKNYQKYKFRIRSVYLVLLYANYTKKSKNHDNFTQLVSPNINSGGTLLLIFDNRGIECNDQRLTAVYIHKMRQTKL